MDCVSHESHHQSHEVAEDGHIRSTPDTWALKYINGAVTLLLVEVGESTLQTDHGSDSVKGWSYCLHFEPLSVSHVLLVSFF